MSQEENTPGKSLLDSTSFDERHYKEVRRKNIIRLLLTYVTPLILLSIYFYFQYDAIVTEGRRLHLKATAENQANILDLFLTERLVNISNLIDDPKFPIPPPPDFMQTYLKKLEKISKTFVDIGFFDSSGIQISYAGPFPSLENRNYRSARWYATLEAKEKSHIITDIYMGFRQRPHFTIAVSRTINNHFVVLRATLDPEKMYEYISSLEGSSDVYTSIVNKAGYYQLVTSHIGTPLESSSIVPPVNPNLGVDNVSIDGRSFHYGYSWLKNAEWALIVQWASQNDQSLFSGFRLRIIGISSIFLILLCLIIINRANRLVDIQKETDRTRAQLEHASKLASVGELAAGIAHEINNPLAAINEEAGLMKDLIGPDFTETISNDEIIHHLDSIQESVYHCRDITRKLLGFVRKSDFNLQKHDIHKLIDIVVDGIWGREMIISNISVVRDYSRDIPEIITDGNQLEQVILNIINNGVDAIGNRPGTITVATRMDSVNIYIDISDTGCGMTGEQMEKVFLPFYTTKEVGKGTGLGMSVSYGIIKNLGGKISVKSTPDEGSTFTIALTKK